MQDMFSMPWIPLVQHLLLLGMDGISLPLVLLTSFLSMLAMGASWPITKNVKAYCILFLLLETGMLGVFLALDFFLFYVFWEVMLLPMYFLIGVWGGPRREYAAIKFFLFTLVGSVLMLIAMLMLYFTSDLRMLSTEQLAATQAVEAPADAAAIKSVADAAAHVQHSGAGRRSGRCRIRRSTTNCCGARACSWWAFLLLFIGFVDQGAGGAGAHLAARRPRRGPHADFDDPGRRAAEDGRLRHHPHLLSDLPRRRLRLEPGWSAASAW